MRNAFLIAMCVAATPWAASSAVRVWAVSDGVRVNPVTGELLEARRDIHADYPAGDFRRKNLVWDAETRTVALRAARNEFTAFQAIVESDEPVEGIDVSAQIPGLSHVDVFKEWYVQVRRPSTGYERSSLGPAWYPDALMPARPALLNAGFPFSIPDLYNNIPSQKNHAVWIDVFVPHDARPGAYRGELRVAWKGGDEKLAIALEVWKFALPQENHISGDIWNGSMRNMPPDEELATHLSGGSDGLPAADPEHPAESAAAGLAGL